MPFEFLFVPESKLSNIHWLTCNVATMWLLLFLDLIRFVFFLSHPVWGEACEWRSCSKFSYQRCTFVLFFVVSRIGFIFLSNLIRIQFFSFATTVTMLNYAPASQEADVNVDIKSIHKRIFEADFSIWFFWSSWSLKLHRTSEPQRLGTSIGVSMIFSIHFYRWIIMKTWSGERKMTESALISIFLLFRQIVHNKLHWKIHFLACMALSTLSWLSRFFAYIRDAWPRRFKSADWKSERNHSSDFIYYTGFLFSKNRNSRKKTRKQKLFIMKRHVFMAITLLEMLDLRSLKYLFFYSNVSYDVLLKYTCANVINNLFFYRFCYRPRPGTRHSEIEQLSFHAIIA